MNYSQSLQSQSEEDEQQDELIGMQQAAYTDFLRHFATLRKEAFLSRKPAMENLLL